MAHCDSDTRETLRALETADKHERREAAWREEPVVHLSDDEEWWEDSLGHLSNAAPSNEGAIVPWQGTSSEERPW